MTTVSARPDNLAAYRSKLEPADRDLQSIASGLRQVLETYRTRSREFGADHTALAHELGEYAAWMAEHDTWVGRVGEAFRRADRAPGPVPVGVVLTTDESVKTAEKAMKDEQDAALRHIREALDPGFWGVGRDDLITIRETLKGLSPSQLDAVIGQLTNEELQRWLDLMDLGWFWGGMSDDERREILNIIGASASLETIQRLSDRADWVRDYFRPDVEDTDAWEDGNLQGLTWSRIEGELFAQGEGEANPIDPSDVKQQGLGDCYLMASLAAIAQRDPEALRRMIQANPNGTYTVTFRDGDEEVRIVVTPDFPTVNGQPVFAGAAGERDLWPLIIEKAYAQWRGGYGEIEGGRPYEMMEQLTGREAERHDSEDVDSPDQIRQWLNEGRPLCVNTTTDTKKVNKGGYIAYHSYYVVGVEGDTILLRNPWGWEEGVTRMSMADFEKYAGSIDVGAKP